MIEVEYQPRTRVIIHEYSRYESLELLIRGVFGGAPPGSNIGTLKWVNGVVLFHNAFPMTDEIVRELLEGRLHWNHVSFAPLNEFRQNHHDPDLRITVTIVDVSNNPVFEAIGRFIRERFIEQ
jgi:hypothetical protein